MSDVRANSGVPVTGPFAGITTPSACAPLVVDQTTGWIYALKSGDIVTLAGGGGTVQRVAATFGGGIVSISGSPISGTGTLAFSVAGQSGGLVYFSGPSAWASTAGGTSNQVAHGGTPPTFTKVDLVADVSGLLAVANGGTSLATLSGHAIYVGNGTSAPTALAVGANNTYLKGSTGANPAFTAITLASADFANQGTTTTVLHGNAAGNPSFLAVSLTGDVAGVLPMANGGTGVAVSGPAFSAYLNANQAITASTFTKIQFDTEEFDTNNNYDNATNYRFTPTVGGYYQISARTTDSSSTTPTLDLITIYKNGARFKDGVLASVSAQAGISVSALISMNGSTDYVEIFVFIAAAIASVDGGQGQTYFQGAMVRPT